MYNKKTIILYIIIFSSLHIYAQHSASEIKWYTFSEAIELNKTNPKKIFIDVYTNWCGWCKKMDQDTFKKESIINELNKNFYAVKFNAEDDRPIKFKTNIYTNPTPNQRRSTHQLAIAILDNKLSYPSYVILDENNERLTVLRGYLSAKKLHPILTYLGENYYVDIKWESFLEMYKK